MNFRLQNPSFSSSEEQGEDLMVVPSNEMINQYNREYSMIVGQVQRFLDQIKQSVQRFVAYNNFGANLNMPSLLTNILAIENIFKGKLSQTANRSNDPKSKSKLKYETSFNQLMQKMGDILKDFIECELEFKKEYFGVKMQKEVERRPFRQQVATPQSFSVSSLTNSSKSSKLNMQHYFQLQEKEEKKEAELRAILKERLKPKTAAIQIECKSQYSTTENLYRLNQKFERMLQDMKTIRNRQQKLIQLFNLNRGKKSQIYESHTPFPSTDVSVVTSENEEMDLYLQEYKPARREDDSITEQGYYPKSKGFMKRGPSTFGEYIE